MTGEACAHTRIAYLKVFHGNGTTSDRWECELCRCEFRPFLPPSPQQQIGMAAATSNALTGVLR